MNPIVIIGAAAVVGSFFVAWWAVAAKTPASIDLQTTDDTAGDLRSRQLRLGASDRLGTPALERLGRIARRWSPAGWLDGMSRKLASAGSPEGWTVERLLGVKVVLGLALGLLTAFAVAGNASLSGILLIVAAASLGFFTPDVLLTRRVEQRKDAIRAELSTVIDQLSMMVQAGLGIDAAIARAAQTNDGPLSEEFARVGHDVRVGLDRGVALDNLADRADIPELKSFVAALTQADRLGSPVSQTLEIQSQEIRVKRRQFAEEQAMKLPVKLLFPMVFCILPVLMVVLLAPAAIKIFDTLG
jgi:tight adherence protein C